MRLVSWVGCALALALGGCGAASDPEVAPPPDVAADASAAPAAKNEGYPIRLSWPAKVGQKGRFRAESEEARVKRLRHKDGTEETKSTMKHVVAKGIYAVESVNAAGRVVELVFDAESFVADYGEERPPIRFENVKIRIARAESEADALVTVDDRVADAATRDAIDSVLSITVSKAATDDEIFGSSERRRIGEVWPIRGEVARRSLAEKAMRVPEGAVTGDMRLVRVDKHPATGIECEEIVGKMEVTPFEIVEAPAGSKTEHGKITMLMRALVPLDRQLPRLEDETTMATEVTLSIPGAGMLDITSRKATHTAFEPL